MQVRRLHTPQTVVHQSSYSYVHGSSLSYLSSEVIITTLETLRNSTRRTLKSEEERTYCMAALVGSVSSQELFTSRTISSIHLRSAGVRATNRSSLGFRNSRVAISVCEEVLGDGEWREKETCTFTNKSISFCCVTIVLVLPQSQL